MIWLRWCALWLWWVWAPAWAEEISASERADAALLQVELWLDMGELGMADALARRGARTQADDPRWHRARLLTLAAAGMEAWIEGEYVLRRAPQLDRDAHACWAYETGRTDALTVQGPAAAEARVRRAIARGEWGSVDAQLDQVSPELRAWVRVGRAVAAGQEAQVLAAVTELPSGAWRALSPLRGWRGKKSTQKQVDAVFAAARSRVAVAPVGELLQLALMWLALEDADALGAVSAELVRRSAPRDDLQRLFDGFTAGPEAWSWWEAPPRARWNPTMLDAVAATVARQETPTLPWARPDEREHLARATAARLRAAGREAAALRVLDAGLGACGPSAEAYEALAAGESGQARARSAERLIGCLADAELRPQLDPARLDVVAMFEREAEAWAAHGELALRSGRPADAAIALGLATRLAPTAERLASVRAAAGEAGTPVDPGSGVPSIEALAVAVQEAGWLRPSSVAASARADLARARTLALLMPGPITLAARSSAPSFCVPMVRSRCMVEWAVARAAAAEAKVAVPKDFPEATDRGAQAAAESWLVSLSTTWFARRAALDRLVRSGEQLGLDAVLAAEVGAKVGRPAPEWRTPGIAAAALQDQVVVLAFWASWCGPCFPELAALDGYQAAWAREGLPVQVVAIGVDESEAGFQRGLRRLHHEAIEVVYAPQLRDPYRVSALPARVVIDRAGVVQSIEVGYDGGGLEALDAAVRALAASHVRR
jgi:thiol-disulfide isomerase/thioredoxin